jgi:hypothetical protein
VDYSVGGFPLLVVGLFELVAINWIYGKFRLESSSGTNYLYRSNVLKLFSCGSMGNISVSNLIDCFFNCIGYEITAIEIRLMTKICC